MDFWPEFLANSWGREFVAGGLGGAAGIVSGYPLDTLRIRQQHSSKGSAVTIFRHVLSREGPLALYKGMGAPLASVTFQNAMVFQIYAILSRTLDKNPLSTSDPPSYRGVFLGGFGTGAIQSLLLSPVELVKIRLQLEGTTTERRTRGGGGGPVELARTLIRNEGIKGIYRGLTLTVLRDAPAHGVYFWTYEYTREKFHPSCRKNGQESFKTMLMAGGLAGVASWVACYPVDVLKTRYQAVNSQKYKGIFDCYRKSVREEGYRVLWRGLGTAVARAFVVNGAIFTAYETALRCLFFNNNEDGDEAAIEAETSL